MFSVAASADPALIIGSAEHEAYYYEKIERFLYKCMAKSIQQSPDISMTKTWLSLGEDGQKALIARVKRNLAYGKCSFDIENDEQVSRVTFVFIGFILADMALPTPNPEARQLKKNPTKSSNPLLKTAICHARLEKQNK